jgi:hypothetical protein
MNHRSVVGFQFFKVSEYFKRADCTKGDGIFEINEIPFGSYYIVVNTDDKISAHE